MAKLCHRGKEKKGNILLWTAAMSKNEDKTAKQNSDLKMAASTIIIACTMSIPQSGTWSNVTIRKMAVLSVGYAANYKAWLEAVK